MTVTVWVCKICGEEFLNFIVDHVRREHGDNVFTEEQTDNEPTQFDEDPESLLARAESEGFQD